MLDGVTVDDLTDHFLKVATDGGRGSELSDTLREFFHDARNRLNSLKIGLYVARRDARREQGAVWEELDLSYRGLERLVDRIQTICRPVELAPIHSDLGHWLDERRAFWSSRFGERRGRIEWAPPTTPAVGWFDPMRLIQALDALVCWRAGEGGRDDPARLAWRAGASQFHVEWSEPQRRVDEPLEGREGRAVSMTLPLLARIIAAHAGSMEVSTRGGLVIRLTWPLGRAENGG
jgi:hypothetical protein